MTSVVALVAKKVLKAATLGTLVLTALFGAVAAETGSHPQHTVTVRADGPGTGGTDDPIGWG
ncbi:hypothetical protein [Streptomyces sp. NPDC047841]|uniref:hypothetical protein n=1 Tax=Streptomyces sp. NPDC047841 TaxID=3154708 RepID=UPI003455B094